MLSKNVAIILTILHNAARAPISKVAKKVGLSENEIIHRLDKMEEEGYIINYILLMNSKKFGKNTFAILNPGIELKNTTYSINWPMDSDKPIKTYRTTGQYSIKTFGLFDKKEQVSDLINNLLLHEVLVRNYNVDIITKCIRNSI